MIVNTDALAGFALDWAAGKAQNLNVDVKFTMIDPMGNPLPARKAEGVFRSDPLGNSMGSHLPSRDWLIAGPLIANERISLIFHAATSNWVAQIGRGPASPLHQAEGKDVLVAAMRCFVKSQLGATVDVPDQSQP